MPVLKQQHIYAELIGAVQSPVKTSWNTKTKALPSRFTLHADKPEWVGEFAKDGTFHERGSGRLCMMIEKFSIPYVVVEIGEEGEQQ